MVGKFLDRLAQKSNTVYENIRERIVKSAVVGADETGCRVNGKKHWFHVWRNVKIKTKISGQFRNKDGKGADRYAKIRSVIDTTVKNGQEVYAALVCLANCKIVEVPE